MAKLGEEAGLPAGPAQSGQGQTVGELDEDGSHPGTASPLCGAAADQWTTVRCSVTRLTVGAGCHFVAAAQAAAVCAS